MQQTPQQMLLLDVGLGNAWAMLTAESTEARCTHC